MLDGIQITCSATEHVSLAHHESAVPVIREVVVANASENERLDIRLRIERRPAFVRPNDPAVDVVLRDAAAKLVEAGRETGLNGYTTARKSRAWELSEAIWAAIADRRIAHVLPPASFERAGQKVRDPSDDRKVDTCLDLSLLYAACLEQAGLNPVLVPIAGHAFVGVWLQDDDFASAAFDDIQDDPRRKVARAAFNYGDATILRSVSSATLKSRR